MRVSDCIIYVYVFRREFFMTRVPFVSNTFVGVQETIASSYKGGEGGEGTYHRHPDQAITTRINHRNEVAAENGRGRQEKGTEVKARASVRARAGAEGECQSR